MTDNIFLFCDVRFVNRMSLEKYIDPLLARLPEEKQKLLVPNGVYDRPTMVRSHSLFCRFKKECTCEKTWFHGAQFVLSDRRPAVHDQPYTYEMTSQFRRFDDEAYSKWGVDPRVMDASAWAHGLPWAAGRFWNPIGFIDKFEPIWRQTWDTVTVTEHEHSEYGATLWQPIGNSMYEWAHYGSRECVITGLGRIAWDADGNGRLFRITQH